MNVYRFSCVGEVIEVEWQKYAKEMQVYALRGFKQKPVRSSEACGRRASKFLFTENAPEASTLEWILGELERASFYLQKTLLKLVRSSGY